MPSMTDEEADGLDEAWTKNTPTINPARPGIFARQRALLEALDRVSANYILNRAEAAHKSPAEIIGEMVREKIRPPA
ncbi:MAG: hypothetical protein LBP88_02505 [Treponema sp.]|jgi:hypothetical protein|nr:hypothetical protein [Treponema sp.]